MCRRSLESRACTSFNGFGDKDLPPLDIAGSPGGGTIPTDLSGDMSMQYGTASLIVQKPDGSVRPYRTRRDGRVPIGRFA